MNDTCLYTDISLDHYHYNAGWTKGINIIMKINIHDIIYIYTYILVSLNRYTDHNEHTRILAVRYLL